LPFWLSEFEGLYTKVILTGTSNETEDGMTPADGLSRIHQVSMRAHDIERAVRFYRDALGLPFLSSAPPRLAFFDCDGVRLMLSTPEPGFDHPGSVLYFAVEDIQQMRDRLTSRGIAFRTEPHKIATLADREVWLADFEDSEGNMLALMSEPRLRP
jgi:predicted enzyme related to lactoylglutathione lyase